MRDQLIAGEGVTPKSVRNAAEILAQLREVMDRADEVRSQYQSDQSIWEEERRCNKKTHIVNDHR